MCVANKEGEAIMAARDNLARQQIYIPATISEEDIVLRVAAYCRVSTDSDDQVNSFNAQNSHYTEVISSHDKWELVDIYADEGISGRSANKRDDFQRLLKDCRKGRIDKILVKSISRFARNTTECLEAIRELKALGISIFFEEHNIDTKMVSSEMLTAVLAACAQAESESISKNMRWSYQKRMESGNFITCKAPLGYRLVDGQLVIEDTEAEVVRMVFRLFLSGWNTIEIAEEMTRIGIPQKEADTGWCCNSIQCILKNEKYVGDALLQKKFSTDDFPPIKKWNRGQMPKYYVEYTHPPIIDRETFEQAQKLYQSKRPEITGKSKLQHSFKQKITCGCCGSLFRRTVVKDKAYWVCSYHNRGGDCSVGPIQESELFSAFLRLYFNLTHHPEIFTSLLKNLYTVRSRQMLWSSDVVELNKKISDLSCQSHSLAMLNKQRLVDPDVFITMSNQLAEQLRKAKQQKERLLEQEDNDIIDKTKMIMEVLSDGPDYLDSFDEELFCELIDKIIVQSNTRIRFRLKNRLELPESIERTVR